MIDGLGDRGAEGELFENVERKVISFTADEKLTDEKKGERLEAGKVLDSSVRNKEKKRLSGMCSWAENNKSLVPEKVQALLFLSTCQH